MALEPELKLGMLRNIKSSIFTNSVQQFGNDTELRNQLAVLMHSFKDDMCLMAPEQELKLVMAYHSGF